MRERNSRTKHSLDLSYLRPADKAIDEEKLSKIQYAVDVDWTQHTV